MDDESAARIANALERIASALESNNGQLNLFHHIHTIADAVSDLNDRGIRTYD